MTKMKVLSQYW